MPAIAIPLNLLNAARTALDEGEALLASGALEQARGYFQFARGAFERVDDRSGNARALLGLGRVLLGLEEPSSREALEDAGTVFEDLGDDEGMRHVEQLLRAAESSVERESPRSFHSAGSLRASAPSA